MLEEITQYLMCFSTSTTHGMKTACSRNMELSMAKRMAAPKVFLGSLMTNLRNHDKQEEQQVKKFLYVAMHEAG